jgi:hypothetical protein
MRVRLLLIFFIASLVSCSGVPKCRDSELFTRLAALCGKAFAGRLVSSDPQDTAFASQPLVMHIARCDAKSIRIPFHAGEDRSRTWVLTKTDALGSTLQLKHEHRHQDGSLDALSNYGGDSDPQSELSGGSRVEFPADAESIALFTAQNRSVSNSNVWALELDDHQFAYELRRPGRHFRVEFDLRQAIPIPPPAW